MIRPVVMGDPGNMELPQLQVVLWADTKDWEDRNLLLIVKEGDCWIPRWSHRSLPLSLRALEHAPPILNLNRCMWPIECGRGVLRLGHKRHCSFHCPLGSLPLVEASHPHYKDTRAALGEPCMGRNPGLLLTTSPNWQPREWASLGVGFPALANILMATLQETLSENY